MIDKLTKQAISATLHCLTGCLTGEVLGMTIATALAWSDAASITLAIVLAFIFGYAFSVFGISKSGVTVGVAIKAALIADTASIVLMETVANFVIWFWPGALDAELGNFLYWASLAIAFAVAFVLTVPLNRWLIARGRGHATIHQYHNHE